MSRQFDWGDLLLFVGLGALFVTVLLFPGFGGVDFARFNAAMGLYFSGLLIWVTARYTRETTKMARASEKQIEALQHQLDMEYEPNVLLVADDRREGETLLLVNLGRHHVWVASVTTTAAQIPDRPIRLQSRTQQLGLAPGGSVKIEAFPRWLKDEPDDLGNPYTLVSNPSRSAEVTVDFYYSSTGPVLHRLRWMVQDTLSGLEVGTTEPPPWPRHLNRLQ